MLIIFFLIYIYIENYIVIIIFVATAECTFLVKILQGFSGINLSQPRFIGAYVYVTY